MALATMIVLAPAHLENLHFLAAPMCQDCRSYGDAGDFGAQTLAKPMLQSVLHGELQAVDRVLRDALHSDVALIEQIADHIIAGGGKRLRPAILMLTAQACGYRGLHHHTLAAVIEMIHTATLLHDDVVDESALRRGHATANATFGNAASVLVGDFLYSRAFQLMVGVGSMRVLEILSQATNVIAEGEVLQLMHTRNP